MTKTVVIIGVAGIQRYLFRSNKLKENVGASFLVQHVMEDGLLEQMAAVDGKEWFTILGDEERAKKFNRAACTGEVIYLAGGNAVLLFESPGIARDAVFAWSRWLLQKTPGLRPAVGMAEVTGELQAAYQKAMDRLAENENAPPFGSPLLCLPVGRTCLSTGGPTTDYHKPSKAYLSDEALTKRKVVGSLESPGPAQSQIQYEFRDILGEELRFPLEMEELGGESGQSRVAVVHIDGNGMGEELQKLCAASYMDNGAFLNALRGFASKLKREAHESFRAVLTTLKNSLPDLGKNGLTLHSGVFPLRPLVHGGDDLTFVCDARLGLPLAECYLKTFGAKTLSLSETKKIPLTACAGVAIVPAKFPFTRACKLAEELCGKAKSKRREIKLGGSWLDFQVVFSGMEANLGQMRKKRFLTADGKNILFRPWPIDVGTVHWVECIKAQAALGKWPRSVVKDLRTALTGGPDATGVWLEATKSRGNELPLLANDQFMQNKGWNGNITAYFDCLEVMENYLPLTCPPEVMS